MPARSMHGERESSGGPPFAAYWRHLNHILVETASGLRVSGQRDPHVSSTLSLDASASLGVAGRMPYRGVRCRVYRRGVSGNDPGYENNEAGTRRLRDVCSALFQPRRTTAARSTTCSSETKGKKAPPYGTSTMSCVLLKPPREGPCWLTPGPTLGSAPPPPTSRIEPTRFVTTASAVPVP